MKKILKPLIALLCASAIFLTSGCTEGAQNGGTPTASDSVSSDNSADGTSQSNIDLKAAITAALNHAGLTESQVTLIKTKLDYDSGAAEYEIEFTADSTRYEYEINAADGSVSEFSAEQIPIVNPQAPSGETDTSDSYITEAQAKEAALKHAGLTESQVTLIKTKLNYDSGAAEYEIEFTANSTRYEYEINAADGSISEFSAEQIPIVNPQAPSGETDTSDPYITEAQAKEAALKHAGLTESQVVFVKTKLDYDSGVVEYDIEFIANSTRYEYEIKAADGTVLEYSSEVIPAAGQLSQGSSSNGQTQSPPDISLEEAKSIALKHAGVSESAAVFIKAKPDYDDGAAEYDIEFTANSTRYEYEIRASDGEVLEFSAEQIPSAGESQSGTALISEEEAKNIALKHMGFKASQVSFTEVKLEHDDGAAEYEVEFRVGSVKYEVKINASNGWVIEVEIDD